MATKVEEEVAGLRRIRSFGSIAAPEEGLLGYDFLVHDTIQDLKTQGYYVKYAKEDFQQFNIPVNGPAVGGIPEEEEEEKIRKVVRGWHSGEAGISFSTRIAKNNKARPTKGIYNGGLYGTLNSTGNRQRYRIDGRRGGRTAELKKTVDDYIQRNKDTEKYLEALPEKMVGEWGGFTGDE